MDEYFLAFPSVYLYIVPISMVSEHIIIGQNGTLTYFLLLRVTLASLMVVDYTSVSVAPGGISCLPAYES